MKIAYSCPYVPAEFIAAHGLEPSRVSPARDAEAGPVDISGGMCRYAHDAINAACAEPETGAIILTTVCDQMRRAKELVESSSLVPVFLMNVPSTWRTARAHMLYVSELERLGRFLLRLGAEPPSKEQLSNSMMQYEARRLELLSARGRISARKFSERIMLFHSTGRVGPVETLQSRTSSVPVAFLGGPLRARDLELFDIVAESGGEVVLDGTETGERTMPGRFDGRRLKSDPLVELAGAYFGSIPDAFRRPNSQLYVWLERQIRQKQVRCLILVRHVWCDIWHAEKGRLKEWLTMPFVDIELAEQGPTLGDRSRIQALMESVA